MLAEQRTPDVIYQGERYYAAVVRWGCVWEVWRCDAGTLQDERRIVTTNDRGIAVRVAQGLQKIRHYDRRAA